LEFAVGDHVYLKVSPMKGMKRFGMKGKLAPRYIGPFHDLVWERGIQVGVATIIGRSSSRYLLRVTIEEVFEGTRGCCTTGRGTTRG
jgi:hypothetical protein